MHPTTIILSQQLYVVIFNFNPFLLCSLAALLVQVFGKRLTRSILITTPPLKLPSVLSIVVQLRFRLHLRCTW